MEVKTRCRLRTLLALILPIVFIVASVFVIRAVIEYDKERDYQQALQYIKDQQYSDARKVLGQSNLMQYKDQTCMVGLCHALEDYECQDVEDAYYTMQWLYFEHLTEEELNQLRQFENKIINEYDELVRKEEEVYQKKLAEANGVPFVGMKAMDIYDMFDRQYTVYLYNKWDGTTEYCYMQGKVTKFKVVCRNGVAISVEDLRNSWDPVGGNGNGSNKDSYGAGGYSNAEDFDYDDYDDFFNGNGSNKDSYGAGGYSNAEDFYYDHYDDFFDYEEAEDYYNRYN